MTESVIGLHIYAVKQHPTGKPRAIKLATTGDGARLANYCPQFFDRYSQQVDSRTGTTRSWFLEPQPNNAGTYHGIIRYGSSGFTEEIRDRKTRELRYNRLPTDIGTIPLYYRLWVPSNGESALLALQTYGTRSCVGLFQHAFSKGYRAENDGFHLTFSSIVPTQLASFQSAQVKSFSLIKHEYSSDSADNQLEGSHGLVDLNVSFRAKRRDSLVFAT